MTLVHQRYKERCTVRNKLGPGSKTHVYDTTLSCDQNFFPSSPQPYNPIPITRMLNLQQDILNNQTPKKTQDAHQASERAIPRSISRSQSQQRDPIQHQPAGTGHTACILAPQQRPPSPPKRARPKNSSPTTSQTARPRPPSTPPSNGYAPQCKSRNPGVPTSSSSKPCTTSTPSSSTADSATTSPSPGNRPRPSLPTSNPHVSVSVRPRERAGSAK